MGEPEKPEPKTGKRIVSKREYAKITGTKHLIFTIMSGFALFTLYEVTTLLRLLFIRPAGTPFVAEAGVVVFTLVLFIANVCLVRQLVRSWQRIDPGVPITRANTGDLPAPDSLVRASAEPLQAQETVLLRAAAQGQQTPVEQLVRPAGGQE